jgi:hypothetical protein
MMGHPVGCGWVRESEKDDNKDKSRSPLGMTSKKSKYNDKNKIRGSSRKKCGDVYSMVSKKSSNVAGGSSGGWG